MSQASFNLNNVVPNFTHPIDEADKHTVVADISVLNSIVQPDGLPFAHLAAGGPITYGP